VKMRTTILCAGFLALVTSAIQSAPAPAPAQATTVRQSTQKVSLSQPGPTEGSDQVIILSIYRGPGYFSKPLFDAASSGTRVQ